MKIFLLILYTTCFTASTYCQQEISDTIKSQSLPEIIVKAYEQNKRLKDVSSAINYINTAALERYDNTNLLPAINATAGAKMEERSPGSYRLNIRGSSLRSPFGVRNVKVYYNNIPLTDAGGTTYLNQLGFYDIATIEILKGPGSSFYGAGTGGVMLLEGPATPRTQFIRLSYSAGSYGLQNTHVSASVGNDTLRTIVSYQHQSGNGYRDHSALKRDIASWELISKPDKKSILKASFFYGNLYYQTPGALTLEEYDQNPAAARPQVGATPGAVAAEAAIFKRLFFGGISYQNVINNSLSFTTALYGAATQLNNPAIRNYARNNQPHYGGRIFFSYKRKFDNGEIAWHTGGELQKGFTTSKVYKNKNGHADSLLTDDEINIYTWFIFSQANLAYKSWIVTAGASFNSSGYDFTRLGNATVGDYNLSFSNQVAPRFTLLKKLTTAISFYAAWSKGFSPPTTDEVFPSGSFSNPNLSAEQGTDYELGLKGSALSHRLSMDLSAFYFRLNNTIVQRRDAAGGDYYTNAGGTRQKGLETQLNYALLNRQANKESVTIWASHILYNFRYKDFKQLNNDFSGNDLPGVAKNFLSSGIDASWKGLYVHLIYQYSSSIALNDANTAHAGAYHLLSSKLGYKYAFSKMNAEIFAGGNNLLNTHYSLGSDINAFGGRYYNAAPLKNFYSGLVIGYK